MADILFLGTGGGRLNLVRQLRGTGGFLIRSPLLNIHVDPGPGALLRLHSAGADPSSLDVIICTHMHIDHVSDAGVLIEAMTGYTFKKRGLLIAPKSVLDGDRFGDKSISTYHQHLPAECAHFGPSDSREFEVVNGHGKKCKFKLTGVMVKHDAEGGFGFVLEMDGVKIGYTSDTEYLPAIHNAAFSSPPRSTPSPAISSPSAGLDVLIANNLKSAADGIPDHLHSGHLIQLLKFAKPKACLLSHMGMGLINSGPELEAARIESESGILTRAGRDGFTWSVSGREWVKSGKSAGGKSNGESAKKPAGGQKRLGE